MLPAWRGNAMLMLSSRCCCAACQPAAVIQRTRAVLLRGRAGVVVGIMGWRARRATGTTTRHAAAPCHWGRCCQGHVHWPRESPLTDVEVGLLGGGAHVLELLQDGGEVLLRGQGDRERWQPLPKNSRG